MVCEDEVGGGKLAEGGSVRLDEAVSLFPGRLLEQLRLHPLVPVEDEHGQKAADVGPHRPSSAEVDELRSRLLRDDDDVVP